MAPAEARGRTVVGGRIAFRVPWPLASIDPHRADDPTAAIFADALFDSLYAHGEAGVIVPGLAEADPETEGASLRVRLRSGIRTSRGRALDARDAAASIARARSAGARAWLADVPTPKVDGRSLVFAMRDSGRLTRALASPLTAVVPSGFNPDAPEGTGPFRALIRSDALVLTRNPTAARGPSFLEEVVVRPASDLVASLRSFEAGTDDLGWLAPFLHEPRAGSRPFDFGGVGWAVLFTGKDALSWDAPGVAQRLCDGIPPMRLSFALGPPWPTEPEQKWGGPPTALVVRDDAPWLVELARALAANISQAGHEITVKPVPPNDLTARRIARNYGLALDVVRPAAPGGFGAMVSLATADNPGRAVELVQHPPKLGDVAPRTMTRTLRCGVVGDVRVQGGRMSDVLLAPAPIGYGFDLGATSRARTR